MDKCNAIYAVITLSHKGYQVIKSHEFPIITNDTIIVALTALIEEMRTKEVYKGAAKK
jgi:hypothetical protein